MVSYMLKKNIRAALFPLNQVEDAQSESEPIKPRFSVPDNVYTPPTETEDVKEPPPSPTFENGSPMVQNAQNVFTPQSNTQPAPSFNVNDISYLRKSNDETPLQKAEKERNAELEWQKKPVNQDKGWKGAIFEGIQNFLHSMGESYRMNPRASWQQILAGGAVGTGLGYIDRTWNDRRNHERKLAEAQRNYELQLDSEKNNSALADAQANRDYKTAQINELARKPEKERTALNAKFDLEAQKQLNRLQMIIQKDRLSDENFKGVVSRNGKFYRQFKNGKEEPVINPATGEQEVDLLNSPVETTSENGTKGFAKFSQILTSEATKNYRDAILGLNREKFEETKRSNRVREGLAKEQFDFARQKWTETVRLRQQALTQKAEAEAQGNIEDARKYELEAKKFEAMLKNWKVNWKAKIGTGGFKQEDYDELTAGADEIGDQ